MSARLFRSFTAGKDRQTVSHRHRRRARRREVILRVAELRAKVQKREPLTDEDHRDLAKMGPNTLLAIGYVPKVTLT